VPRSRSGPSPAKHTHLDAISKTIEDEYNGRLRDLLKHLGYDATARRFPITGPNKPDGAWSFVDPNGSEATAIFSGKMGTARQMTGALNTAGDYKRNISRIEPVIEAFAVTYPEGKEKFGLYALESEWHPFHSYPVDSLDDVAETIQDVLSRRPPPPEQSESMMIRLLRSAVSQVSRAFSRSATSNLVEVFGKDNPLFISILPVKGAAAASESQAREAAAYLLVNQLLFYRILSSYEEMGLPKIDVARIRPKLLHPEYFQNVLKVDYKPVFEFDIAQELDTQDGATALRAVLRAFEYVQADRISADVIGKIFHNLIPLEKRKPLAAYYTNSNAAHLLSHISIDNEFDRVMDPACGSGTMLVAAYTVKSELYEGSGRSVTMDVHEKFVADQLMGIDIMPFSAHLAVVNLSLQAPEHQLQRVRVAIHDSLELEPNQPVESSRKVFLRASKFRTRRIDSYGDDESKTRSDTGVEGDFRVTPVDVIQMNPPFSDSDRIPKSYKSEILKRFASPQFEGLLQGKYSLQLPFLLLAEDFLVGDGRVSAVLPVTTFTGEAFGAWVTHLVRDYTVRVIIVGFGRTAFSENTALSECLVVAEKTRPAPDHRFVLFGARVSPPEWDLELVHRMARTIRTMAEEDIPGLYVSKLVPQAELEQARTGLQSLINSLNPEAGELQTDLSTILRRGIPFRELESRVGMRFLIDALANKELEGPQGRGLEFYCAPALTYFSREENVQRKSDRLVIEGSDGRAFVVRDNVSGVTFPVPKDSIIPYARRISGLRRIDASNDLDFIAGAYYRGLDKIIGHMVSTTPGLYKGSALIDPKSVFVNRVKTKWPRRISQGRGRVWMANKVNLAAPRTALLAAYSELNPMIGRAMWVLSCPEPYAWVEKGLVLWLNSTLFLAQALNFRAETQGTWGRIDKHPMLRSLVPDFSGFSDDQRRSLVALFDEVRRVEFQSIIDQLGSKDENRMRIDRFFVELLEPTMTLTERGQLLERLYGSILMRLQQLLGAM